MLSVNNGFINTA